MREIRRAGILAAAVVAALMAAACFPPSQTPSEQTVPPGGRVVVTLPSLHHSQIVGVSSDASSVLYSTALFLASPAPSHYWVYDDETGTKTSVPVVGGDAEAISPDGTKVVFSSRSPGLQVGPVAANCPLVQPWQPTQDLICTELYLFDVTTGETRQLTGLEGSSDANHSMARFSPDGGSIYFARIPGSWAPTGSHHTMDLTTGVVEPAGINHPGYDCCTWDRGTHVVAHHTTSSAGVITTEVTSTDVDTGETTTFFSDPEPWAYVRTFGGGRYLLLSRWSNQYQLFRWIDLDTGTVRKVSTQWFSEDLSRMAVMQQNVAPDGIDRLILAPFAP